MKNKPLIISLLSAASLLFTGASRADQVTDWNANLYKAAKVAAQLPPIEARIAAILQIAVYDAVNGIERKYEAYFVTDPAPPGARAEAAAAQAAYTVLKAMYPAATYPTLSPAFDAELRESLAGIPGIKGKSVSISRGLAWGQHVAEVVLAARNNDGFSATYPNYFGGTGPGVWRSIAVPGNPDGTLPAILPQFRYVTPFALISPDQFRPGPPPALSSPEYAADVNEVKAIGRVDSTVRTADQTKLALL